MKIINKLFKLNYKKKKYFYYKKKKKILPNIITRFPPEPNGYLHIGHIKSIYLNFELSKKYKGKCNLRFDDTNPYKEEKKYIFNIINSIKWFNYKYLTNNKNNIYYASNYFNYMYNIAILLIKLNFAYIDEQNIKNIYINKGNYNNLGNKSYFKNISKKKSLKLFKEMKIGKFINSQLCLRIKFNMLSKNLNLRDPIIYRIRHLIHFNTKNKWCIYPTYIYAHPIEDALENITYSICTLEFEDHKPFYNWLINFLLKNNFIFKPIPKQFEISKLNIKYLITSKRIFNKIINKNIINSYKDLRLPTILNFKKKGYTSNSIKMFCKMIDISKNNNFINLKILKNCLRKDLNIKIPKIISVIYPIKLIINNFYNKKYIFFNKPLYDKKNKLFFNKYYKIKFKKIIFIEKYDFKEYPNNYYYRSFLGNKIKLLYSYIIECIGYNKDKNNNYLFINFIYFIFKKKIKNIKYIHWINKKKSFYINIIIYNNLFKKYKINFKKKINKFINLYSKKKIISLLEKKKNFFKYNRKYHFFRIGYFIKKKKKFIKIVNLNKLYI